MNRLRDDKFSRRGSEGAAVAAPRQGVAMFALLLLSVGLMVLSWLDHPTMRILRGYAADAAAPLLRAVQRPLDPLRRAQRQIQSHAELVDEVERLRRENQRLRSWEWRARELERRSASLSALARVVEEPGIDFISARVIADSGGAFAKGVLVGVGADRGIRRGQPVVNGDGLVGRIVEAGRTASRLILITDLNSRIPVLVGPHAVRAIMVGDNSATPRLHYVASDAKVEAGDEVYTSGTGGLLPRGLRIGQLDEDRRGLRVVPLARLDELDYVSVLLYSAPAATLVDEPPAERRAAARAATAAEAKNAR